MSYIFKYRRLSPFFSSWKKLKVSGHQLKIDQNKMVLFFENGSQQEIAKWNECEIFLGQDWFVHVKKTMEQSAGQKVV